MSHSKVKLIYRMCTMNYTCKQDVISYILSILVFLQQTGFFFYFRDQLAELNLEDTTNKPASLERQDSDCKREWEWRRTILFKITILITFCY